MTLDRQKQLLKEICSEYDLETLIAAIREIHAPSEVRAAIPQNTPVRGYMHPTEGWVSSRWPE